MEKGQERSKFAVGDKVKFECNGGVWVGVITDLKEFQSGWNFEICGFLQKKRDIK